MIGTKDLEALIHYLQSKGITSELGIVACKNMLGRVTEERAIILKNQNIDFIRGKKRTGYYGYRDIILIFTIKLKSAIAPELRNEIPAESLVIARGNVLERICYRLFGFGGTITDVKWKGDRIANALNGDSQLSNMLVEYACFYWSTLRIKVDSPNEFAIDIVGPGLGPSFTEEAEMVATIGSDKYWEYVEMTINDLVRFEIYDRMGKCIKEATDRPIS